MIAWIKVQLYPQKNRFWLLVLKTQKDEDIKEDDNFCFVHIGWCKSIIICCGCSSDPIPAKLGGVVWGWETETFMPSTRILKVWSSSQKWF